MSFVERIKLTDGTEVASINTSNQLEVAAGLGFASVQTEDTASAGGETGTMILAVRNDSATTKTSADGDFSAIAVDAAGRVGIADLGGSITVDNTGLTALSDSIYADSFSGPSKGIVVAGVYDDGVNDPVTKFLQTNSGGKLLSVIEDGGNTITVDGTVAATQSGTWILGANSGVDIGDVTINNASIAVTGTFWQATQPVSIASAVPVTDNSGSLTVDAPVGTPVFVRLSDGTSAISTLPVSLASVPSHPVTNAGTFAVQVDGAALTSLQLIDDTIATAASAALTKLSQVGGTDGTNARILSTNTSGHLNIADGGNSITVDGTFWQATQPVSIAAAVAVTDNSGSLTVDAPVGTPVFVRLSDGASAISTLPVSLASVPSHPVTNAGTFAVQVDGSALTSLQLLDDVIVTDNAGFTDGTTKLSMVGYIYDEVAGTALTENDAAAGRINVNRAVVNTIEDGATRGRYATVTAANAVKVDGSAVTQPVSGTVTANAGTGNFATNVAQYNGSAVGASNAVHVQPGTGASFTVAQATAANLNATVLNQYTRNGTATTALLDTTTAANNRPFPVLALSADGAAPFDTNSGAAAATTLRTVLATRHEAAATPLSLRLSDGTNFITNLATNLTQLGGNAVSAGNGVSGTGTLRVTIASDSTGTVAATQSGTWNINNISGTISLPTNAATSGNQSTMITALQLLDDAIVTDDAAFTVGTTKVNMAGGYVVAHGANPDAADAGDAGAILMNRHRIPFMLGGHPNLQSAEYITTAAQTNDNVLPLISAGTKYVITGITVTASAANTVNTSVRLGFGTAAVPTQGASGADAVTKVILSHPGIAPGSGVSKGHAGGIVGIGGDGEELYITCSVPTGGSVVVQVDYYTIES